jgi:hypothetical protein
MSGQTIARYHILHKLGEGGMRAADLTDLEPSGNIWMTRWPR